MRASRASSGPRVVLLPSRLPPSSSHPAILEARLAARLYGEMARPRGRAVDLAIAACALTWQARLWTLNRHDVEDVPGLELVGG